MGNNDVQVISSGGTSSVPTPANTTSSTTERGDTGTFKCTECNSIFRRRDHLGRHMMTQHNENCQRTKCPFKECDTEMVRRDHLRRHISQVHKVDPSDVLPYSRRKPNLNRTSPVDPLKRFKCVFDGCDAELSRKDHLCRHIKNIHKADPRQVIGHMYKQPRPGSGGGAVGGTTTSTTPTTSLTSAGGGGKAKKKSSKKKVVVEDLSTAGANHSSDNHHSHPPQGSHQPHPSTLSDYDYGADYGGEASDERDDDDDDDNQLKMEVEEKEENEEIMCLLCCYSFYPEAPINSQDVSLNVIFKKFFSEVLSNYEHPSRYWGLQSHGMPASFEDFFSSLTHFPLCSECVPIINRALDNKVLVDHTEVTVRKLQLQILRELVTLQKRLVGYWQEMKQIETVVNKADELCLQEYMQKHTNDNSLMSNGSFVLLLRDAVVSATSKLEKHRHNLKSRFSTRDAVSKNSDAGQREATITDIPIKKDPGYQDETQIDVGSIEEEEFNDAGYCQEDLVSNVSDQDEGCDSNFDPDYAMSDNESNEESGESSEKEEAIVPKRKDKISGGATSKVADLSARKVYKKGGKRKKVIAQLLNSGVDISGWTKFKKNIFKHTRRRSRRQGQSKVDSQSLDDTNNSVPDPRLEYNMEYDSISNEFTVGSIPVILHEQEQTLECSSCNHRIKDYSSVQSTSRRSRMKSASLLIQEHIQRKHLAIFQCVLCSANLGSYRRYAFHVMGHNKKVQCEECDKTFSCEEYLLNHMWNKHMSEEQIAVALSLGQTDRRKKKKEWNDELGPPRDFICPTCGKGFPTISTLKTHEQVHEENRDLQCSKCGKVLKGKSSLYHHLRYTCQEKESPGLRCDHCPAILKNKVVLDRHVRYTHGQDAQERPFRCEICGAGFAAKNTLRRHIVVHSDDRPFSCANGCGSTFKSKRHTTRHEKTCSGRLQPHRAPRKSNAPGIEMARNVEAAQLANADIDCNNDF